MFDVKIGRIMSVNNVSEASNCWGHIKLMLGGGHRGQVGKNHIHKWEQQESNFIIPYSISSLTTALQLR